MQYVFAGICFVGCVAGMITLKFLDLNGWLTAAIIVPLILLVVYSTARIRPKKPESEQDTRK